MGGNWGGKSGWAAFQKGFTLMEMLVVVSMLGILTAIALPSYREYVIRGKLPEATSNLAAKRVQIEQYFQDNRTYVGAPGCQTDTSTSKHFLFVCTVELQQQFTLRADGTGDMTGFTFTINESGGKATAAVPSGWSLPSPNSCWIIAKGGRCN